MTEYAPDKWQIIKIFGKDIPLTYKVFACWYGGYLNGDSWKMNSGISKVTEEEDHYLFEGFSGSVYKCYKNLYGANMYGHGILQEFIEQAKEKDVTIEKLPEDTDWLKLDIDVS